ncbi:unnamed protein product [Boreogadus saida]
MRLNFTTSWIFQGWITLFVLAAQKTFAKSIQCGLNQYQIKGSKCCDLCGPGFRLNIECSGSKETKCLRCSSGEYQPGWTQEKKCLPLSTCDKGKGFMPRPENPLAEEPCRCRPGLQCSLINCEYCEAVPTCGPGYGLEPDLAVRAWGEVSCSRPAPRTMPSADPLSRVGPHSWVIVSVLSVINRSLSAHDLLLFCYKDKLKLLSVNLRSCIQNLKRTRIQQETLAPLYHSGARTLGAGATEPLRRRRQVSTLCTARTEVSDQEREQEVMSLRRKLAAEEGSERSGEPEEVSDDEGGGEEKGTQEEEKEKEVEKEEDVVAGEGPLADCGPLRVRGAAREPLEVGENEDCSQAVSHRPSCLLLWWEGQVRVENGKTKKTEKGRTTRRIEEEVGQDGKLLRAPTPGHRKGTPHKDTFISTARLINFKPTSSRRTSVRSSVGRRNGVTGPWAAAVGRGPVQEQANDLLRRPAPTSHGRTGGLPLPEMPSSASPPPVQECMLIVREERSTLLAAIDVIMQRSEGHHLSLGVFLMEPDLHRLRAPEDKWHLFCLPSHWLL